ncbi:MAG: hypothetical protein KME17_20935 [Cyanosarcina radialis HA8281-LM2]|jgi:acyl-CoA reductase-like NAD-dependent aldehyde dehydrogenase|nr:hypothetical protein [Cyanosarcina radialis HA8281-LM2]
MTNSSDRLDRIEALLERFIANSEAERAASSERLKEIELIQQSNAKAIQALADRTAGDRNDRARLYQAMADLASAQAGYYQKLESQDQLIETLSRRQGEIVQILKVLSDRLPDR